MATRKINLANALGVGDWGRKNWGKNVLALATPDSMEEDCAAILGCEDMLNTWELLT